MLSANTTTRRAVLAGIAAAPVIPAAVLASDDPVLAVIEDHRKRFREYLIAQRTVLELDCIGPTGEGTRWYWSVTDREPPAIHADGPEWIAAQMAFLAAALAEIEAKKVLLITAPTTTAGLVALMAYLSEWQRQAPHLFEGVDWMGDDPHTGKPVYITLASDLIGMAGAAAATLAVQS